MNVTKTKIQAMISVGVTDRYYGQVKITVFNSFFETNSYGQALITLTKKETTQLIRALKSQRDRKGVQ